MTKRPLFLAASCLPPLLCASSLSRASFPSSAAALVEHQCTPRAKATDNSRSLLCRQSCSHHCSQPRRSVRCASDTGECGPHPVCCQSRSGVVFVRLHNKSRSDRETRFTRAFLDQCWTQLGSTRTRSTAEQPHTHGHTERANRTFERRCVAHASISLRPTGAIIWPSPSSPSTTRSKRRLDSRTPRRDQHRRDVPFVVGAWVLLSTFRLSALLGSEKRSPRCNYLGPLKILRVVNTNAYELDLPAQLQIHPVRLNMYRDGRAAFTARLPPDSRPPPELCWTTVLLQRKRSVQASAQLRLAPAPAHPQNRGRTICAELRGTVQQAAVLGHPSMALSTNGFTHSEARKYGAA